MKYASCFLIIISILFLGCASQRYAKQAFKNEQVGLFEDAAELYLKSLMAKKDNVDAKIGAKKNAQISLDEKLSKFHKAYIDGDSNGGVSLFLEAKKFYNRFTNVGVSLYLLAEYEDEYDELKKIHIEQKYREGFKLLNEEKFKESESYFNAIKALETNYKDVNQLWQIAHYEPIYRQGKMLFTDKYFRKSYELFSKITKEIGQYKEANQFKQDAFDAAVFTISVNDFEQSMHPYFSSKIRNSLIASLLNSGNPFLKIVDNSTSNENAKSTHMLGIKAILSAKVLRLYANQGNLNRNIIRAYYKDVKETSKDGIITKTAEYKKVEYAEFTQTNTFSCVFKYQLTSTETGEILVVDEISVTNDDFIRYAKFGGDYANIVPGYWKSMTADSPEDFIRDNYVDIVNLKRTFNASSIIKEIGMLENETITEICAKSSTKISLYNPEK